MAIRPEDFFRRAVNKLIVVTVKTGKSYLGRLRSYDEYDNLYMEDVKELETQKEIGRAVFKGGNITNVQRYRAEKR